MFLFHPDDTPKWPRWRAFAFWLAALAAISPAQADPPPPRDFNADTPGRTFSPYTVAETYLQLEGDAVHITQTGNTETIQTLDPVLKYGLTNNLDIELQTGGLLNIPITEHGRTVRSTGYGDTTPAIKYNIIGNDSQDFSAALKLAVKIPTATPGFGNGQVEYNVTLPTQAALPFAFTLQVQQEIDLLKNQTNNGHHFNYAEDVSLSRSFGKFNVSIDVFAQSGTDHQSPAFYTADVGVAYAITTTSLISLGAYAGLNRYAPPIEAYLGYAFRF